jgi:DNA-binding transcriptional MerR regulator
MHDWVENLLEVQRIDVRMAKIQAQLDSLPKDIEATEELQRADERRLAEVGQRMIQLEKELKGIEMDVEALNAKKSDFQAKSTMIKNNDEYRAALHQIEQCAGRTARRPWPNCWPPAPPPWPPSRTRPRNATSACARAADPGPGSRSWYPSGTKSAAAAG